MYESPLEFHFWLLGWRGTGNQIWHRVGKRSRIPSYPGGVNLLHRVNYWLTLDLVASGWSYSTFLNMRAMCTSHSGAFKHTGFCNIGKGVASSKFCLNIAGDTPSYNRLFDAIASHCIPVINGYLQRHQTREVKRYCWAV
ncbi:hypothetical protein AAHA92_14157 [Salvia divinorum]|uniref:Exostosin GT47 domain-containing protein n=1 Tax=Salvia divinorum TaxID=28513 RepID=A0ABD1HB63_SALDI